MSNHKIITVPARQLKAAHVCCNKNGSPQQRGIKIDVDPESVRMQATDGYVCCRIEMPFDQNDFTDSVFIEAPELARSIRAKDSIVTLNIDTGIATIYGKSLAPRDASVFQVIDVNPPDLSKIIPARDSERNGFVGGVNHNFMRRMSQFFKLAVSESGVECFTPKRISPLCFVARDSDNEIDATFAMATISNPAAMSGQMAADLDA